MLDIDAFSSIRGVELEETDERFAAKFSTGACSKPWQEEVSNSASIGARTEPKNAKSADERTLIWTPEMQQPLYSSHFRIHLK